MLDAYLFDTLQEVRTIAERWLEEYNQIRPHQALQASPPISSPFNMPNCLLLLV